MNNENKQLSQMDHRHVKAWLSLVGYVILPIIIMGRLMAAYPEILMGRILGNLISAVGIGLLLVMLAYLASRCERGSLSKMALNMGFVLGVLLWFVAILGGSTTIQMAFGEYQFQLGLERYLWLLILVASLNISYYAMETLTHHTSRQARTQTIPQKPSVGEAAQKGTPQGA
ncbi:MAG: hypothetical protein QCI38_02785 [Candidatus Thermoplasmatota archaeon]|nr:hypothetical protein [Candidatus Thermoplasmatota archaeon]